MVKFGKEYRRIQIKQWQNSYINYKLLKQQIKTIRANIDLQNDMLGRDDSTRVSLGHPSLRPIELVPEDNLVVQEGQDLQSLYNLKHGQELKNFIELLEKEFRKCYIFFVNQEKELYKRVNGHCYSADYYKEYNVANILKEIKEISTTIKFSKRLNGFINDNITALKKILKKFDKKYRRYFGVIGPKYILTHLTSQNSDLEYFLQYKLIDESTSICEYNLNLLLKKYNEIKNVNPNIDINDENINLNDIDTRIKDLKKKIYSDLDCIDELTYFKIQYREWFYYAKFNERIVKNNPSIYENDIYNPALSSTYYKDSILEKCISNPEAVKEIKKSQSPLSHSNMLNLNLIYIYSCLYGVMLTNIFPLIPSYFDNYIQSDFKALFLLPLIIPYIGYLIPYTIFLKLNYRDKFNTYMNISYIISYILILISCLMLIFVSNSIEEKNSNIALIIISRLLFGLANNKMMSKKYITLYLPKFVLSDVSKKFILSELIGEILGPLISLALINIEESDMGIIKYTNFNSIGWFGMVISLFLGIIHFIFFTKPLSSNFFMVKDEKNITGSKYYQKSEDELNRKQYLKEQNLMYKKQYDSMKKNKNSKKIKESDIIDNDDINNLIVTKSQNDDKNINDENDSNNQSLEEKLIDNEKKENSFDKGNNSLDVSLGGNIALTLKQKNMINTLEKVLEKRNEECNFDDMNQISKKIKLIIKNEKNEFGYINQNILLILIIYTISSLSQLHLILNYIYYIQEIMYEGTPNMYIFCLLIFILFLPQITKVFFIIKFYQVNYKFKIFIFGSVLNLLILNIPLMFKDIYESKYAFIILNILLVLGCNIINLSCSCYLSFIMLPDWQFLCIGVGHSINYVIILGKIIGGIISLIFSNDNHINHWIWMGITAGFFIYILILIFFTRIIRIKGITRIIRKMEIESNKDI